MVEAVRRDVPGRAVARLGLPRLAAGRLHLPRPAGVRHHRPGVGPDRPRFRMAPARLGRVHRGAGPAHPLGLEDRTPPLLRRFVLRAPRCHGAVRRPGQAAGSGGRVRRRAVEATLLAVRGRLPGGGTFGLVMLPGDRRLVGPRHRDHAASLAPQSCDWQLPRLGADVRASAGRVRPLTPGIGRRAARRVAAPAGKRGAREWTEASREVSGARPYRCSIVARIEVVSVGRELNRAPQQRRDHQRGDPGARPPPVRDAGPGRRRHVVPLPAELVVGHHHRVCRAPAGRLDRLEQVDQVVAAGAVAGVAGVLVLLADRLDEADRPAARRSSPGA